MTAPAAWRTLLGDHPSTRALRQGRVSSPALRLEFADVAVPNKAFKRVVRDLEFDVAELALMTFLMARSRGVPLRMLPVVLFSRNPLRADTVNHVVVVRASLAADPGRMAELLRLFRDGGDACAGPVRRSLEAAIAAADAQCLLASPLAVDDLLVQG